MIAECLVVEVRVTGDDCPLADATRETGVDVDARPPQLRTDGNALLGFSADAPESAVGGTAGDGAGPDDAAGGGTGPGNGDGGGGASDGAAGSGRPTPVRRPAAPDPAEYGPLAVALDADDRVRYLHAARAGGRLNFRCLSKQPCVVHDLADAGFVTESVSYRDGVERYTGAVVGYDVLQGVLAAGGDRGDADVTVERIHPLAAEDDESVARRWGLTPGQEEALRTALRMGYFSVPRGADAGDVAAELGVSKSAFLERLRRAQSTLLGEVFPAVDG